MDDDGIRTVTVFLHPVVGATHVSSSQEFMISQASDIKTIISQNFGPDARVSLKADGPYAKVDEFDWPEAASSYHIVESEQRSNFGGPHSSYYAVLIQFAAQMRFDDVGVMMNNC
jgi:hypothetical protein